MTRRPYGNSGYPDTILCQNINCNNVSSHLHLVEKAILDGLAVWLDGYKLEWGLDKNTPKKKTDSALNLKHKQIEKKKAEIEILNEQLEGAYAALERGVYDDEEHTRRKQSINKQIKKAEDELAAIESVIHLEEYRDKSRTIIVPKIEHILSVYYELESPAAKNELLKSVLKYVKYTKEKGGRWHNSPDDFELELFPIVPENTGFSSK
jgi:hypothetical protein